MGMHVGQDHVHLSAATESPLSDLTVGGPTLCHRPVAQVERQPYAARTTDRSWPTSALDSQIVARCVENAR